MSKQQTLSIIKPNAVKNKNIGDIISIFEKSSLTIKNAKLLRLDKKDAEGFYKEHIKKPFFDELVKFMTSGPILALVLEGPNAIEENRRLMGATNPAEAKSGTIRSLYANSMSENAVHGSDSQDSAESEIAFFFHDEN